MRHREKHGRTATIEYGIWKSMLRRCRNAGHPDYRLYGARGIRVCAAWEASFCSFLEHMGPRPSERHSLDRINSNGNYEPGNCRWATLEEQNNNTSRNRYITANGETLTVAQWARRLGLDPSAIFHRLRKGWPDVDAVTRPKAGGVILPPPPSHTVPPPAIPEAPRPATKTWRSIEQTSVETVRPQRSAS